MKKTICLLIICFASLFNPLSSHAQEIYNEVVNIMNKAKTVKFDKQKSLQERKIATFKYDAIYYLLLKGSQSDTFTERELGEQVSAMLDFLTLYVSRLSAETKKSRREVIIAQFKKYTIENALFHDMDKEVVYGYVDNENFITQFSLDTNWINALAAAQNK